MLLLRFLAGAGAWTDLLLQGLYITYFLEFLLADTGEQPDARISRGIWPSGIFFHTILDILSSAVP